MSDGLYREIGLKIRDARERLQPKLSQERLAKRLGKSRATIVNIEAGRQHAPLDLLWKIAEILGTELVLLIPRRDELVTTNPKIQLDKQTMQEIKRAAKGDPEKQKELTGFVSRLKSSLQQPDENKRR